ncbi:MAG TPA: DUF1015 family protein [Actinomycetes bacterium]|nr:DUF1015 family protein [Actinomycetes bacterium]
MTLVRPFPARLVRQEHAANVVCPMHDALTSAQRANLLLENPLSYLNVTRNALDMPGASYDEIGAANAAGLERLLRSGAYGEVDEPALYVYRIAQNGDEHTGIVADLDVSGFVDGRVLPHEDTNPEKVEALVKHFEAVPTRSELVAVMYRDDELVNGVVAKTTAADPILELTDLTGVQQQVWRIADADAPVVIEQLGKTTHYVADGHHRVAATVARWRGHGSPRGGTVLCVLYPESQTHLLAFHRLVAGPIDTESLLVGLKERYDVAAVGEPTAQEPIADHGVFGLHVGDQWYQLTRRSTERSDGAAGLDVALIDDEILRPILGVYSGHERVSYVSDLADVIEVAATHPEHALFLLAAPTHDELITVAERGEHMPPKSTYIEPKPRAGVFLHPRQGPVDPRDLPSAAGDSNT